jgi:1,4-dihydroxy-2-naphthoate octaprenyltransferase
MGKEKTSGTKTLISVWIDAFRLHTLPLALSSIITGSFVAVAERQYRWSVIILAVLTTVLLQILSNLANDYGDAIKGTDNENRVGPQRAVQSGAISTGQMKNAIIVFAALSLVTGLGLLYLALGNHFLTALLFFGLGLAAIAAAIKYTVGDHAYGYRGLGDLFVFIFFGLVAVMGTYYLNTLHLNWVVLLPASTMGLLSAGVLNLNNMRDIDNDRASGKHTLATVLDYQKARVYHAVLIGLAFLLAFVFVLSNFHSLWNFLFLLSAPLFLIDLIKIFRTAEKAALYPYLKRLALATLVFSILFGVGLVL